jgi:hypothetical protein
MRYPLTVDLLSDAQRAGIKKGDNLVNRFAGHGIHISRRNVGATLESGLNNVL